MAKLWSVAVQGGETLHGTAPDIARQLRASDWQHGSATGPDADRRYQEAVAKRVEIQTGKTISTLDADGFIEGLVEAGVLTITPMEVS